MFPGAHATVYRNEAGEVLGWSDESNVGPEYFDCCGCYGRCVCYDDYEEED